MDREEDCSIFTLLAPGELLLILFFINMVFQSENAAFLLAHELFILQHPHTVSAISLSDYIKELKLLQ